jgi:hypothetical protein
MPAVSSVLCNSSFTVALFPLQSLGNSCFQVKDGQIVPWPWPSPENRFNLWSLHLWAQLMLNASVCSSGMSSVSKGSSVCWSCLLNTEFGIFDCVAFSCWTEVECPDIISASCLCIVSFQRKFMCMWHLSQCHKRRWWKIERIVLL